MSYRDRPNAPSEKKPYEKPTVRDVECECGVPTSGLNAAPRLAHAPGCPVHAIGKPMNLAYETYETYGKAVGCGDEYRGWTWAEIVVDIHGDDQDHTALVAELEKRFPL